MLRSSWSATLYPWLEYKHFNSVQVENSRMGNFICFCMYLTSTHRGSKTCMLCAQGPASWQTEYRVILWVSQSLCMWSQSKSLEGYQHICSSPGLHPCSIFPHITQEAAGPSGSMLEDWSTASLDQVGTQRVKNCQEVFCWVWDLPYPALPVSIQLTTGQQKPGSHTHNYSYVEPQFAPRLVSP